MSKHPTTEPPCNTFIYLTKLVATIHHEKSSEKKVAGVFLDLQKAFDSVWHSGLILYRLRKTGVDDKLLNRLHNFLTRRTIFLEINDYQSDIKTCKVGFPQGRVLSPILFIIYIRDMLNNTDVIPLLYADDSMILTTIETKLLSNCGSLCH